MHGSITCRSLNMEITRHQDKASVYIVLPYRSTVILDLKYTYAVDISLTSQIRIFHMMRIREKSMGSLDGTLNVANMIYYCASQRHW